MELSPYEKYQLAKNANLLSGAFQLGKFVGKPLELGIRGAGAVAQPIISGVGAGVRGVGNVANWGINNLVTPVVTKGLKGTAGVLGAAGAGAAGTASSVGSGLISGVGAPIAKGITNAFARNPISSTVTAGLGGMGLMDLYRKNVGRNFTNSSQNLMPYEMKKRMFTKAGSDMSNNEMKKIEKVASILASAKKLVNYGDPAPSLLGLAAMGGIGYALKPTLETAGQSLQRMVFPVSERIRADEEIAKKQVGMIAAHQADAALGQYASQIKEMRDMPMLESNLEYMVQKDPIINDVVSQDLSKQDELRETLQTVYKFAPDIATNRQAAQSILREAAMSPDGGLNYNTIKLISDAQKSISGR
jgi:hypothetical protein